MPPTHLFLLRHGIAVDRGMPGIPDSDRPLTAKGRKRLRRVLKVLKRVTPSPSAVISSSLVRASQTAEMAREVLRIPNEIEIENSLKPGGSLGEFLRRIQKRTDTGLLLTGHEPD